MNQDLLISNKSLRSKYEKSVEIVKRLKRRGGEPLPGDFYQKNQTHIKARFLYT